MPNPYMAEPFRETWRVTRRRTGGRSWRNIVGEVATDKRSDGIGRKLNPPDSHGHLLFFPGSLDCERDLVAGLQSQNRAGKFEIAPDLFPVDFQDQIARDGVAA